jgi:hypothetical protein
MTSMTAVASSLACFLHPRSHVTYGQTTSQAMTSKSSQAISLARVAFHSDENVTTLDEVA